MRTCAFIVVLAAMSMAGCGDRSMPSETSPPIDVCANGGVDGQIGGNGKIGESQLPGVTVLEFDLAGLGVQRLEAAAGAGRKSWRAPSAPGWCGHTAGGNTLSARRR